MEPAPKRYLTLFVGNATYDEKTFVAESLKLGVSRAVPYNIAMNLDPGDLLLAAIWDRKKKVARLIGAVVVTGVTVPAAVMEEALARVFSSTLASADPKIKEELSKAIVVEETNEEVKRNCGTMRISKVVRVAPEAIPVVKAALREVRKARGNFKTFVNGKLVPFSAPVEVQARFLRSPRYIELPPEAVPKELAELEAAGRDERLEMVAYGFSEYARKFYLTKAERASRALELGAG